MSLGLMEFRQSVQPDFAGLGEYSVRAPGIDNRIQVDSSRDCPAGVVPGRAR